MINEFTIAPAEVWVSSNDILEGSALYVRQTGEVVPRHLNARIIITDNCSFGDSDDTTYLARMAQDLSVANRFWHSQMTYLPVGTELYLIRQNILVSTPIPIRSGGCQGSFPLL